MRHLAAGLSETWPGAGPDLPERMKRWNAAHPERLEALTLEELAVLERRGASGDPHADQRDAELAAHGRLFAEMLASVSEPLIESAESPPEFSRRVAVWSRAQEGHRREIEAEARAAWGTGPTPGGDQTMSAADERPRAGRDAGAGGGRHLGPRAGAGRGPGARAGRAPRDPGLTLVAPTVRAMPPEWSIVPAKVVPDR